MPLYRKQTMGESGVLVSVGSMDIFCRVDAVGRIAMNASYRKILDLIAWIGGSVMFVWGAANLWGEIGFFMALGLASMISSLQRWGDSP